MNIKDMIRKNDYGKLWIYRLRILKEMYWKRQDDYAFLCKKYKQATGHNLNLANPQRYTEKIQWLKLFYRNELMPICSDKSQLGEYLTSVGYKNLAVEHYGTWKNAHDIPLENLPDSFVLKASHGSGMNLIVRDKYKINWPLWNKIMNTWLKMDIGIEGREWPYSQIVPQITAEKYMEDDSGELRDYKIFCFDGIPTYMEIDENRFTQHKRKYFDCQGNLLGMEDSHSHLGQLNVDMASIPQEMFSISAELSKPFPFVRIDFYEVNKKLYVGEFTFFDASGLYSFTPDKWDFIWGEKLVLPEPNYNLELYNSLRK